VAHEPRCGHPYYRESRTDCNKRNGLISDYYTAYCRLSSICTTEKKVVGNFEFVRIWKEHVVRYRETLGWESLADTEENNANLSKLILNEGITMCLQFN